MFFQLPDRLPVKAAVDLAAAKTAAAAARETETNLLEPPFHNQLKDLGDGLVGKLLMHQSGRMKLVLGDHVLDVTPGTEVSFHQQLVAVNTDYHTPYFASVAPVPSRVVAAPNIPEVSRQVWFVPIQLPGNSRHVFASFVASPQNPTAQ